jgi:hypothetical protein
MAFGAASQSQRNEAGDVFEDFARRFSAAVRARDNARHTESGVERREAALSMMQSVKAEFGRCFVLQKFPDWQAVEDAARGDG